MVQLQSVWASADAAADDVAMGADEATDTAVEQAAERAVAAKPTPSLLAVAATPAEVAAAVAPIPAAAVQPTDPDPVVSPAEPPTHAVMPDLSGKSLRAARKELKAAGLKMSVRDNYNQRIDRGDWGMFKVRKQKVQAGAEVELGTRVRVKARMKRRLAKGY